MTKRELTDSGRGATSLAERGMPMWNHSWNRAGIVMAGAAALVGSLGGCISVNAPDKPIVIELNINIRQDVVFALADDAANTVEENADIF